MVPVVASLADAMLFTSLVINGVKTTYMPESASIPPLILLNTIHSIIDNTLKYMLRVVKYHPTVNGFKPATWRNSLLKRMHGEDGIKKHFNSSE